MSPVFHYLHISFVKMKAERARWYYKTRWKWCNPLVGVWRFRKLKVRSSGLGYLTFIKKLVCVKDTIFISPCRIPQPEMFDFKGTFSKVCTDSCFFEERQSNLKKKKRSFKVFHLTLPTFFLLALASWGAKSAVNFSILNILFCISSLVYFPITDSLSCSQQLNNTKVLQS